jgi:hypothetical protein
MPSAADGSAPPGERIAGVRGDQLGWPRSALRSARAAAGVAARRRHVVLAVGQHEL